MNRHLSGIILGLVLLASQGQSRATETAVMPFVHPLFCDHAVLQRGLRVPVWGWTQPGAMVTVSLNGKTVSTTAEDSGRWEARIGPFAAGGPYNLTVSGLETVTIKDVLIGDVWVCSGQSNMEMGIGACNVPNDIATANFPQIRLLTVPKLVAAEPVKTLACRWLPCSPQNILQGTWGGFSAAGYYFGRDLHQQLNVPIGLIHTSWGGTVAEAWASREGLQPLEDFKDRLTQFQEAVAAAKVGKTDFAQQLENWYEKNDPGTSQGWSQADADTTTWKTVDMPQPWEQAGLPDYDGIGWFRREFDLPADWAGKNLTLNLGPIDDFDTTWFNGVKIGQMDRWDLDRVYRVPASAVKAGRNVIAIRVLDTAGAGGLVGKPEQMRLAREGGTPVQSIALAGRWQMRAGAALAKLSPPPQRLEAGNPNVTTVLFNGMIAPLLPYAIKGAIWYQGESNAGRARQYRDLLPAMIRDWRRRFQVGDFPFYIVQLAAFMPTSPEPRDNDWAELREAQSLTAKNLNHCGLAVAIDIGDAADIHPKNKKDVGRRLALCAAAQTYGMKVDYSGPWYKSMKIKRAGIRLKFDHVGDGLVAKGGKLTGFAIAGEDRKFVWADAVIAGKTVLVSSPKVAKPVAVRYAWDSNPVCNLFNDARLPAVPFRTDDWPMVTQNNK